MFDALDTPAGDTLDAAMARAARAVPPAWPLSASVAVNPFLGQTGESLAAASARLGRAAGAGLTLPRDAYAARIASGAITDADLAGALASCLDDGRPADLDALKAAARTAGRPASPPPTVADLAARTSGVDWPGLIADRIGAWAGSHFDEGQAPWAAPRDRGAYAAWRAFASRDLTPEIAGLAGFAAHVSAAPEDPREAVRRGLVRLGAPDAALETYLHRLLTTLGGWGQYARLRAWRAEQAGGADDIMVHMLAIRLAWEEALFAIHGAAIAPDWAEALAAHAAPVRAGPDQVVDAILQAAFERSVQRELAAALARPAPAASGAARPRLQAAFCIDVRSEVFRRALEAADPGVRTIGFAGFFGLGLSHRRFASDVEESRLPVLLRPALVSRAGAPADTDGEARIKARARRAWGRFKVAAVSSFAFVEAAGLLNALDLVADALGLTPPPAPADPAPRLEPDLDPAARVDAAESVLRAMSLTDGFARLVLLCGHGAGVVNNPHASALHCGACGGYSGEVNARLLAALLNDPRAREGLAGRGLVIPADTLFVGGLHDTTADVVTLYADDHASPGHADDLAAARAWLSAAGRTARAERAGRLPGAAGEGAVRRRGANWAQVRPEWGLAGCRAFIAAPRALTAGRDLKGRVFLHDYDWRRDPESTVLTLILTAPVVVASWISLQYYGSAVAPAVFGGGDKLLHNVVGGMGVIEGAGGALRAGIPWQSLHDGERLVHEPLRLTVCVAAPREAIAAVLARRDDVRALFDNGWLHLFALDDDGVMAWRYAGNLAWAAEAGPAAQGPTAG